MFENRYISALIADAEGLHTSVIISSGEKTLFNIVSGLDASLAEHDPSSIYLSFSLSSSPKAFLRHYDGQIKLSKNDDSDLFKKDATFKLIPNPHEPNTYAFQATNLRDMFISVDLETKAALILNEHSPNVIENLSQTLLFRFTIHT